MTTRTRQDGGSDKAVRRDLRRPDPAIRRTLAGSKVASARDCTSGAGRRPKHPWPAGRALATALVAFALAGAWPAADALAQDKAAYNQRAGARIAQQFAAQDVDRNDAVTRAEVGGNIELTVVFNDIDVNRDGVITRAELERYVALRYGDGAQ